MDPGRFRKRGRFVGVVGLTMNVLVSTLLLAFKPLEPLITYALAAALLCVGLIMAFFLAVLFPKRYDNYYARLNELGLE
jgi:hypothetical protein